MVDTFYITNQNGIVIGTANGSQIDTDEYATQGLNITNNVNNPSDADFAADPIVPPDPLTKKWVYDALWRRIDELSNIVDVNGTVVTFDDRLKKELSIYQADGYDYIYQKYFFDRGSPTESYNGLHTKYLATGHSAFFVDAAGIRYKTTTSGATILLILATRRRLVCIEKYTGLSDFFPASTTVYKIANSSKTLIEELRDLDESTEDGMSKLNAVYNIISNDVLIPPQFSSMNTGATGVEGAGFYRDFVNGEYLSVDWPPLTVIDDNGVIA